MKIRLGTRGSKLALVQAHLVKDKIMAIHPDVAVEIVEIVTTGDRMYKENLALIGGKGLFLKEIEEAMIAGDIDIAVHSMKDVPAFLPDGLEIPVVLEREDVRDVLISEKYSSLNDLPIGAVVGSSSSRRKVQINQLRPDLEVVLFRGNVTTRIEKIAKGEVDASLLALAGLNRLGMHEHAKQIFTTSEFLPAVAQGAIGIECRSLDKGIKQLISDLNHEETKVCIDTEREFLKLLGGDCKTPLAGLARIVAGKIEFEGMFHDGKTTRFGAASGEISELLKIAALVADQVA